MRYQLVDPASKFCFLQPRTIQNLDPARPFNRRFERKACFTQNISSKPTMLLVSNRRGKRLVAAVTRKLKGTLLPSPCSCCDEGWVRIVATARPVMDADEVGRQQQDGLHRLIVVINRAYLLDELSTSYTQNPPAPYLQCAVAWKQTCLDKSVSKRIEKPTPPAKISQQRPARHIFGLAWGLARANIGQRNCVLFAQEYDRRPQTYNPKSGRPFQGRSLATCLCIHSRKR